MVAVASKVGGCVGVGDGVKKGEGDIAAVGLDTFFRLQPTRRRVLIRILMKDFMMSRLSLMLRKGLLD